MLTMQMLLPCPSYDDIALSLQRSGYNLCFTATEYIDVLCIILTTKVVSSVVGQKRKGGHHHTCIHKQRQMCIEN